MQQKPLLPAKTLHYSRHLRKNMTEPERLLWHNLRANQLGLKFRRQHPIPPYILDFYCHEQHIAIELDGDTHGNEQQINHDQRRTLYLQRLGIQVIRFTNEDVMRNIEGIFEVILKYLNPPSPHPSPKGGGSKKSPLPLGEG